MNRSSDALDTLRREPIILVSEGVAVDRNGRAYIFALIPYIVPFSWQSQPSFSLPTTEPPRKGKHLDSDLRIPDHVVEWETGIEETFDRAGPCDYLSDTGKKTYSITNNLIQPVVRPIMTCLNGKITKARSAPRTTGTIGAIRTHNASHGFITSLNTKSSEKYLKYLLTSMKNMPKPRYVSTCTVMNRSKRRDHWMQSNRF